VFDFVVGTPAFMTCCEMFLISVIFLWTFTAEPYLNLRSELPRCRGTGGALLDCLDVRDILKGYWYIIKIIFCCGHTGSGPVEKRSEEHDAADNRMGNGNKV